MGQYLSIWASIYVTGHQWCFCCMNNAWIKGGINCQTIRAGGGHECWSGLLSGSVRRTYGWTDGVVDYISLMDRVRSPTPSEDFVSCTISVMNVFTQPLLLLRRSSLDYLLSSLKHYCKDHIIFNTFVNSSWFKDMLLLVSSWHALTWHCQITFSWHIITWCNENEKNAKVHLPFFITLHTHLHITWSLCQQKNTLLNLHPWCPHVYINVMCNLMAIKKT